MKTRNFLVVATLFALTSTLTLAGCTADWPAPTDTEEPGNDPGDKSGYNPSGITVERTGADVTVRSTAEKIECRVSGTTTDGSLTIHSDDVDRRNYHRQIRQLRRFVRFCSLGAGLSSGTSAQPLFILPFRGFSTRRRMQNNTANLTCHPNTWLYSSPFCRFYEVFRYLCRMRSGFLTGATSSGSGKTTVTLGLMRALVRRGLAVQPFKCGPDYIDPMYHRLAAGRRSVNLDPWMASADHLRKLHVRFGTGADVCVAEGVMGLCDGWQADEGSSAEVARTLGLPVLLVVDARSAAYSVAPLLWGFRNFRGGVPGIAGVIFNHVGGESHYFFLRDAARDAGVEPLGWLPRSELFAAPSRHLGLSIENLDTFSPTIDAIADALETHVDLNRLLELTRRPAPTVLPAASVAPVALRARKVAVARDEAFNFIYRANLDRLHELGAELSFFSPLDDDAPPQGADLMYIPGGYPEFLAGRLAANRPMREAIRDYAAGGGRILAECGGMLYLCRTLDSAPMCGVLPLDGTMEGMRLHLGYRELHLANGLRLRGHEFHYSTVRGEMPSVARQFSARGDEVPTPLYRYNNVIAGYTHLYWADGGDPMKLFD
jgi:cobyrinic acid a,c-diamide synthase